MSLLLCGGFWVARAPMNRDSALEPAAAVTRKRLEAVERRSTLRPLLGPQILTGLCILVLFVIVAVSAPWIAPYNYAEGNPDKAWLKPYREHLFGTDSLGRDVMSRLLYGTRISLTVGLGAMVVILLLGVPIGALAGYVGGAIDLAIMRLIDVVLAFPSLLSVLLLSVVLGSGVSSVVLAIGMTRWAPLARIVRAEFLRIRGLDFVLAARSLGASDSRIMFRHVLPNSLGPIIVFLSFSVPFAIMAEAALGFIGLGISPPTPSWGVMLNDGFNSFRSFPNLVVFPCLALSSIMFGFVMFGNGLRDLLDPRSRS